MEDTDKIASMKDAVQASITDLTAEISAQSDVISAASARASALIAERAELQVVLDLLTKQSNGGTFRGIPLT